MQNEKLLTISIAAYNVESSLERTLSSLECDEELFRMLDIIIVDDGSTDSTAAIAEAFASKHPGNARLISKANGGYGSTVNTSMDYAQGQYFKLLDGDDTFDKSGLESLLKYLTSCAAECKGESPDLVITPFVYVLTDHNNYDESETVLSDRHPRMQTEPVMLENAALDDGLMMFEVCIKTDVLRQSGIRLSEHCFYTDNEYVMAADLYAETAVRHAAPVYKYSLGVAGQSMSVEGRRLHYEDKIRSSYGVFSIYGRYAESNSVTGSRKLIADKLISTMVREAYVSMMIQQDPGSFRSLLKDFDNELREKYPYAYDISGKSRLVSAVRMSGPLTYSVLCMRILKKECERTRSGDASAGTVDLPADRVLKAAEYIAAACLIIQCRTVYMHLETYGMVVNRSVWVVMMAALAVCIVRRSGPGSVKNDLRTEISEAAKVLIITAAYAGIFILANPVNYLRVIRCASAAAMMIILVRSGGGKRKCREILGCYRNLMLAVAAVSMFGWVVGSIGQMLPCTGLVYIDWSATGQYVRIPTFLGIYYETQWTDWALIHARNTGIFVEAPMAGFAYCMALLTECFITGSESEKKHRFSIALLVISVLSTFSLICYGFLILMLICMAVYRNASKGISRKTKAGIAAVTLLAIIVLAVLVSHKMQRASAFVRVNDFIVGFNAWMAHPLFGGGFESLEYLQQFMPGWRSFDVGFSNSPMEILGQGGLYLAVPYVYVFISSLIRAGKNRNLQLASVTVLFGYLFVFTVVPYQYITFIILTMLAFDGINSK